MKTRKPLSLISYNTTPFLLSKLTELIDNDIVEYAYFIKHDADVDTKKEHKHLLVAPHDNVDIADFCKLFDEIDPNKPLLPLKVKYEADKCIIRSWEDIYLYILHDSLYLYAKGLHREIVDYDKNDIVTVGDHDIFCDLDEEKIYKLRMPPQRDVCKMIQDLEITPEEAITKGYLPYNSMWSMQQMRNYGKWIKDNKKEENEKKAEEQKKAHYETPSQNVPIQTDYTDNPDLFSNYLDNITK